MTRKFYAKEQTEPLVMRIFLRNMTTRLGGGEALSGIRRTVLDKIIVLGEGDKESETVKKRLSTLEKDRSDKQKSLTFTARELNE